MTPNAHSTVEIIILSNKCVPLVITCSVPALPTLISWKQSKSFILAKLPNLELPRHSRKYWRNHRSTWITSGESEQHERTWDYSSMVSTRRLFRMVFVVIFSIWWTGFDAIEWKLPVMPSFVLTLTFLSRSRSLLKVQGWTFPCYHGRSTISLWRDPDRH
jgi:hypothetical protein